MNKQDYVLIKVNDNSKIEMALLSYNGTSIRIKPSKINKLIYSINDIKYEDTPEPNIIRITDRRVIKALLDQKVKRAKSQQIAIAALGGGIVAMVAAIALAPKAESQNYNAPNTNPIQNDDPKIEQTTENMGFVRPVELINDNKLEISEPTEKEIEHIEFLNVTNQISNQTADYINEISYEEPVLDGSPIEINRSSIMESAKYEYAQEHYEDLCNEYGRKYGVDPKLLLATIAQENPFNEIKSVNRGVCCIENIWWGTELTAFNQDIGQYETVTIDVNRLTDPAYSIQIGSMIYAHYFEYLCKECPNSSNHDKILASVIGNNKGIYGIVNLIKMYGPDFISHIPETPGGDNQYIEHVLSYVPDGSVITMYTPQGEAISASININEQPSVVR